MSKPEQGSSEVEKCSSPSKKKKAMPVSRRKLLEREFDPAASSLEFHRSLETIPSGFHKFVSKSQGTPSTSGCGGSGTSSISWAPELLEECAQAVSENDGPRTQYLMWVLNELSSPYGELEQRLASAFLQALFARLTRTGMQYYQSLSDAAARAHSYQSQKKMVLKFQELSPWMSVGIAGANAAILEALAGERKVHIVDISNNFCTQWPTLFEALAMRAEHPPHLRLTTISVSRDQASQQAVMSEITHRLEKFARLMGIPFEFRVVHQQLQEEKIDPGMLDVREDEALIINSFQSLQHTPETSSTRHHEELMTLFASLNPKVVIVVEDEVDLVSPHFMTCFREALRFYSMFFDSLDSTFPRTSNERLMLERIAARKIAGALTRDELAAAVVDGEGPGETSNRCHWKMMMQRAGFATRLYRDEIVDDIQALLRRYKPGWGLYRSEFGLFLTWKEQDAISVSAWIKSA